MDLAAGGGVRQCAAEQVDDQQRGGSASAEGWYSGHGPPEQQLGQDRVGDAGQRDDGMVIFAIIAFSRPTAKAAGTARGGLWRCGLREARCGPGRRPGHPDLIAGPG